MPRNMSFAITTNQVVDGTKDVTRRNGWWNLKEGEVVNAVEKCMGLKKGEKVKLIRQIRIINSQPQQLSEITWEECKREGFPEMLPCQFVRMFCKTHKNITPKSIINRIEYEYI